MVQPQELKAFDKDDGLGSPIFYTFSGNTDEYKYFELNRNTGHIYITSNIPETEFLQPVTLVVQATQVCYWRFPNGELSTHGTL